MSDDSQLKLDHLAFHTIMRGAREEQSRVLEAIHRSGIVNRFLIVSLARAVDVAFMSGDPYPYRLGWGRALDLLLDSSSLHPGVPLFPSDPKTELFARGVLGNLEIIAQLEHFAGWLASSLVHATSVEAGTVRLTIPAGLGAEGIERETFDWLTKTGRARINEINESIEDLSHQLDDLVQSVNGKFITYTEDSSEIEHLFGDWSDAYLETRLGADSFLPDSKFGDLKFGAYCKFARHIVASSRKHLEYCRAALRTHGFMSPMNILTVPADIDVLVNECSALLDCSPREAMSVVDVFIRNPGTNGGLIDPPYVRVGHNCVLRSLRGSLDDIFVYMLESLRSRHRHDWDSAVDSREGIFRQQIAELLLREGVFCLGTSRNIQIGADMTDIDVVALDPRDGILGLFQLKWMDPFGHSMRQRMTKRRNFTESVNKWIDKVHRWAAECGSTANAARVLGFSEHQVQRVTELRVFALGRWFSLFSDGARRDTRAAWVNWPRFLESLD